MKLFFKLLLMGAILGAGSSGSAQAQTTHLGGNGIIGDETLTTVVNVATVPRGGVLWSAAGGEGVKYSKLNSPVLTVPTTGPVTLKFWHRYFFESGWDGGAVYISVNGAAPAYLPDTAFTANPYVSDLSAFNSSVFKGGKKVFTGQSADWWAPTQIESVADLGTLNAGDTVSIQFRGGWDEGYKELAPNWEIGSVEVRDSANTAMLNVDFLNGSGGFTVQSDPGLAGPWVYPGPSSQFEIDGDTLAADRYVPDTPGAIIDITGTDLSVVLLAGTLNPGDAFTLFNLAGGSTLQGTPGSVSLPPGTWDISNLATTGTIVFRADAKILDFAFPTFGSATISQEARKITKYVPLATNVAALSPTFTMSAGATCRVNGNPVVSGATLNFTNPVNYVVTGSDNISTTTYTVTVIKIGTESTILWNGGSGTWGYNNPNWLGQVSAAPTIFTDGNNVIFDNTAGGEVDVFPNVAPASTTVSAGSGTYTFTGGPIAGSGTLTKSGAGTLVLEGNNTYTGKTVIQGGILSSPRPQADAGSPSPLGQNATMDIYNGATFLCDLGDGGSPFWQMSWSSNRVIDLADTSPGTVTLRVNGNDTNFGFGAVTATGTGAKTLAVFTGSQGNGDREAVIFNGPISNSSDNSPTSLTVNYTTQTGSESFVSLKEGGTFTGPIDLIRGSNVNSAYLVIGGVRTRNTNEPGSGTLAGGNYAANISLATSTIFYYNSSATQILSGEISGLGKLTKSGSGVLTLTGPNSYNGATTVSSGTLLVNGTHSGSGAVNVSAGAKLGGTGTLSSITTIASNGELTFNLSTASGTHDKLEIDGPLAFSGASVLNLTTSGSLAAPGVYTLLTASGGIDGAAPATLNLPPGWIATASISEDTTSLLLDVTFTGSSGYETWAAPYNLTGGPYDDDDGDGADNAIEYVLGTDPTLRDRANATGLDAAIDGGDLVLSFNRSVISKRADTALVIDVGTDLSVFPELYTVPDASFTGAGYAFTVGTPSGGLEPVSLRIPRGVDSRKYARLRVVITGP